jgi:hypothetical protein
MPTQYRQLSQLFVPSLLAISCWSTPCALTLNSEIVPEANGSVDNRQAMMEGTPACRAPNASNTQVASCVRSGPIGPPHVDVHVECGIPKDGVSDDGPAISACLKQNAARRIILRKRGLSNAGGGVPTSVDIYSSEVTTRVGNAQPPDCEVPSLWPGGCRINSGPHLTDSGINVPPKAQGGGSGSGGAFVNVTSYAGSPDIGVMFANAQAALPSTGGTIQIPAGTYSCVGSGGYCITISKPNIKLQGSSRGGFYATSGGTTINVAAGVSGINITGAQATVQDMLLESADTGANADVGIFNQAGSAFIQRVTINHFGGSGLLTLGNSPTNADLWHYEDIEAAYNYGDGFRWGSACTDNGAGSAWLLSASNNRGWGFNLLCGSGNYFNTLHVQNNRSGGYSVSSSYNYWFNLYAEEGAGSSFVIQPGGAVNNEVWFTAFGQPARITDSSGSGENIFHYWGSGSTPVQNQIGISSNPGATGSTTYKLVSGAYANSDFGIWDATDDAWTVAYDPIKGWNFLKNTTVTGNLTVTGTCRGCGGGGSGSVSGQASGVIPLATGATTIGAQSHMDDGNTTSGTITSTEPFLAFSVSTSGSNGGVTGPEGTCASLTPGSSVDLLCPNSTAHNWQMNNNNGHYVNVIGGFTGSCAMSSGTSCTFTLPSTLSSYTCFPSIDHASSPPATSISATCSLSGTTATITAGTSNSLTWDALFVGN